jgi:hypothetical protein
MPTHLKRIIPGLILFITFGAQAGTWTQLAHPAPYFINQLLLLSDGTVMAQGDQTTNWYRLTPDVHGSYVNGTWSSLASMRYTRLYYSSEVLTNGRVIVAGAEYGTGTANSELYDPLSNAWTMASIPPGVVASGGFVDSISSMLPDGNVLCAPVHPATNGYTAVYVTASNMWTTGPKLFRGGNQDEASWVTLPDSSILTIDPFGENSERFIPSLNRWINDTTVGQAMYNVQGELGAALLLPNGQAFFLGGNGNTALYTPTGTTSPGKWTAGPVIPDGYGINDAPAAMMVNGKILCDVGNPTNYNEPSHFFEYDPVANSFSQVNGPTGTSDDVPPYYGIMLDLPDGTVLYSDTLTILYDYQPSGSTLAAGQPTITGISENADGSYTLTGTLLNGISEGASYGDDAQMNSNYPLVRVTNSVGNVYYERTYNWRSTGVMTGSAPETTLFTNSAGLPPGTYSLVVVANGISSAPFNFFIEPRLRMASSANNVILTWPTNAVGFSLETTTNLNHVVWTAGLPTPVVVSGQYVVTNPISGTQRFFRLSQ